MAGPERFVQDRDTIIELCFQVLTCRMPLIPSAGFSFSAGPAFIRTWLSGQAGIPASVHQCDVRRNEPLVWLTAEQVPFLILQPNTVMALFLPL